MCGSVVDIQSPTAEIRRGKKEEEEDRQKSQGKNIMACPIPWGGHSAVNRIGANNTLQITQYIIVQSSTT